MITCPNCNHPNPEGATQCEACYTSLPSTTSCPNCGAEVQTDATFCGQCGFNLQSQSVEKQEEEEIPATVVSQSLASPSPIPETASTPAETPPTTTPAPAAASQSSSTQLQIQNASLLHVQTNTKIELPDDLNVIHLGKPNEKIPPDVDVSGFPDSGIVSRIHADIRVEGDTYFIEDLGSSNGTYVNHTPLSPGNRHRLRTGDRIALGKGDLVTFIFQLS